MPRFWNALRNLLLAMLNATLILLALCLWLGWRLTSEVNTVAETVTGELPRIQPLRDELASLTDEISGLRADLSAAGDRIEGAAAASQALTRLSARADALETRLAALSAEGNAIAENPTNLINRATAAAAAGLGDELRRLAGCYATAAAAQD